MNSYERSRREHPAQWHQDQRTLAAMEANYHHTAPEPKPKRPKRLVRGTKSRLNTMWRK